MTSHVFAGWDGSIAGARALQERLAARVVLEDRVPTAPRTIAGFDVGFEDEGHTTRAAAVLLDGTSLQLIASTVQRVPTSMPYVPGLLSFRDTALGEAVAEFNRYNAHKLVVADARAAALRVSGTFQWDNADGFVRLLERGFPVHAERRPGTVLLHSR